MSAARVLCCLPQPQTVLLAGSPWPPGKSSFHMAGVRWEKFSQLLLLNPTTSLHGISMATHSDASFALSAQGPIPPSPSLETGDG